MSDVTRILSAIEQGDPHAAAELLPLVYEDLLPATEFLEDQKTVKKFTGNKLTTEAGLKPPEPIIAVLD